jgi:hypothetical protein
VDRRDSAIVRRADVGRPSAEQLVENDAERVNVGAIVDRLRGRLLGRDVVQRALQVSDAVAAAQAEIEDARRELGIDHDVRRLQIAVLQAERVRMFDGAADFDEHPRPLGEFERGPIRPSSKPSTCSMMMTGGSASARNSRSSRSAGPRRAP